MKRLASLLLCALLLLGTVPAAAAEDAVPIYDADGLRAIAEDPYGSYVLRADVDLGGEEWTPIPFFGKLDGGGHTLYNLTLSKPGAEHADAYDGNNNGYDSVYVGLFSTAMNAEIRDLKLRGVYAETFSEDNCFVAALAGYAFELTVENCSVEGRLRLYGKGKILGVGGIIGFGSGWFRDCSADVELVFEDRNESLHCEQFLGGLAATGKFTAERCGIRVMGYASVNGFVHTGGVTGMYCGYGLVRDRMMAITDCTVSGRITFFEHNFTRRAYCKAIAGEQVDLLIKERNDESGFVRDERFDYRTILKPDMCAEPDYAETVVEPGCSEWGCTVHECRLCGYTWTDSYTPPRHSPGEWETLREPQIGAEGERVRRCSVCGEIVASESIPALAEPASVSLNTAALRLTPGASAKLEAHIEPPSAASGPPVWSSSDSSVAAVDGEGNVSAVGRGSAVIRCACADGTAYAECSVEVAGVISLQAVGLALIALILAAALLQKLLRRRGTES